MSVTEQSSVEVMRGVGGGGAVGVRREGGGESQKEARPVQLLF